MHTPHPTILLLLACLLSLLAGGHARAVETRYIASATANVRAAPNGEIIGSLERGTPVEVHGHSGAWTRISAQTDPPEWVHASLLCRSAHCTAGDTTGGRADLGGAYATPAGNGFPAQRATPRTASRATPATNRRGTSRASSTRGYSNSSGCPCSGSTNCIGPRGGRYCITSGGNKRYR